PGRRGHRNRTPARVPAQPGHHRGTGLPVLRRPRTGGIAGQLSTQQRRHLMALAWRIRPIEARDDANVAAIIRTVMPEFGATGDGFSINDPEVDWMQRAYSIP